MTVIFKIGICITLVSCSDATTTSDGHVPEFSPISNLEAGPPTIDFRSTLEIQPIESEKYPCDSIVVHPDTDIEYSIREIPITGIIENAQEIVDPGKYWCEPVAYEEVDQQFPMASPNIEENTRTL